MPIDYNKYPSDWQETSLKVKERYSYRCGFCNISDKSFLVQSNGKYKVVDETRKDEEGVFQVHLSAIHLDGDIKNNCEDNLMAACQRCHLDHDKEQHSRNRKYGSAHKDKHQIKLFDK